MADTPMTDPNNDPKKYNTYVSQRDGEYTTLADVNSVTNNMPAKKYEAINKALNDSPRAASVITEMNEAREAAQKQGKKFDQDAFMAKKTPDDRKSVNNLMEKIQKEAGDVTMENVTAVSKDSHLPEHLQAGRQRMISVAGHPTLPIPEKVSIARQFATPIVNKVAHAAKMIPGVNKAMAVGGVLLAAGGVASAHTPEERRVARGELAKEFASIVDPSGLIAPSIVHEKLGLPGKSPARELAEDISHGKRVTDPGRINLTNQKIDREQKFLMSPDHPDQLAALEVKDPKTGKDMDIGAALKNPEQRAIVMADLATRQAAAKTPEGREQLGYMREAAEQYVQLESQRREVKPAETVAKAELPHEQRVVATAGVMAGPS